MLLLSQRDFETTAGQTKIIQAFHRLEARVHELEQRLEAVERSEQELEADLQGNDPH